MVDCSGNSEDGRLLWSNLLQEVKDKSSKIRQIPNSLLILGSDLSGKSSLLARLQKSDLNEGVGMEFEFIDVKDEAIDENRELNVWIASGDRFLTNLIKYALDENNFGFTLCIITVSFTEPWAIMESLELWLDILKKHIQRLKLNPVSLNAYKKSLLRHFEGYCDPVINSETTAAVSTRMNNTYNYLHPQFDEDSNELTIPLRESLLESNLGIPIIVVMTKADYILTLEQEFEYDDDKLDFIQIHIRRLCLKYGASLCYTSIKENRNCDILLRYICHRCYGFQFTDTASVMEKNSIFIPAGWDNVNKINILSDNLPEDIRDQAFDNIITKPFALVKAAAQNRLSEPEMAEDEQVFLMKLQARLQKHKLMPTIDTTVKDAERSQMSKPSSLGLSRNRKMALGQPTSRVIGVNSSSQGTEGVLANFFSSLLNNPSGHAGVPLTSQKSTASEPGKINDNLSETEDSSKDDVCDVDDFMKTELYEISDRLVDEFKTESAADDSMNTTCTEIEVDDVTSQNTLQEQESDQPG